MLPRFLSTQYRALSIILFLFAAALGWFFLVGPLEARIVATKRTLIEREGQKERLTQEQVLFGRLRDELAKISPEVSEKINRLLPKGRDVPRLLVELEALANETGLLLKDIGVSEGKTDDIKQFPNGVKPVDLVITVSAGDYATLKRFLDAVEKNVRLLNVKSFTFSKGLQAYTINVQAFYRE